MTRESDKKSKRFAGGVLVLLALWSAGGFFVEASEEGKRSRLSRAYEGAPPLIPHEVEPRKAMCLDCHATGAGGAPITPHSGRADLCLLCHMGQNPEVTPFSRAPHVDNAKGTLPRRGMERGREGGM